MQEHEEGDRLWRRRVGVVTRYSDERGEVTRPAGGMSADHAIIQEGNNYLPVLLITIRPYRSVPTHSSRYSGHLTSGA